MLCSVCNKNTAVIFINKVENGKAATEGLCYNCAKEKGINPMDVISKNANLSEEDIANMTAQLDTIFKDFTDNMNIDEMADSNNINNENNPLGGILGFFKSASNPNEENVESSAEANNEKGTKKVKVEKKQKNNKKRFLDTFGTNLTQKAKDNLLDNVIGREQEIQRVTQILNRRSKNNPCLIGEPGVGKTAIAQGLAIRIAQKQVPAKLLNKEVYLIDMTAIIAGTQFRGQFEARMKSLIDECKTYGNIILVIDEIHNIIGAGDAEHSMNAANILKPALSNGEIQIIGTTTLKEYRKYIEKDSALERRFQPVLVEEPTIQDTINIIKGIKKYYEDYHKVVISNDIIEKTVKMSEKYIHDRFLPDKAIDLIDEACSKINLNNHALYEIEIIKNELAKIAEEKDEAVSSDSIEDYQKAADLKTKECSLTEKLQELESTLVPAVLSVQDIAEVIERWTKIPVTKITEAETQKLLNLEKELHKHIIGQNVAVEAVAKAIRRNRAGLQSTKRPPSFIFVGPTGVGKTELAKSLAYEMFGSEDSIIRIDMSEYMESHSTSKLIGAPPGYVGYDDAGGLTEKVKRKPYSIILLDEIEKAHPDVFNILLQVLDDGKLTDAQGNTVNFENTIIIMTSNAGSNLNNNSIGFGTAGIIDNNKMITALKDLFRPEFLNRVDEIIPFDSLTETELIQIIDLLLEKSNEALSNKEINLKVSLEAKKYILSKGTDLKYGARPLRRAIQKYIEDEIAEMVLREDVKSTQTVYVDLENDNLKFEVK
ncbi:MAG: ATP-dependent Clp protease ATP-binding subunit [Clostridia bacterium]|nr:ATP-dependent Clp protease ATP-binding subunit [Clostridia bacterium]